MFASAKLTNPKRLQKTISELEASSASRSHSLSISLCVPRCSRGRILSALHFFFFFSFLPAPHLTRALLGSSFLSAALGVPRLSYSAAFHASFFDYLLSLFPRYLSPRPPMDPSTPSGCPRADGSFTAYILHSYALAFLFFIFYF